MVGIYGGETPAQHELIVKTGGHFPAPVQIWKGRFGVFPDPSGQMLRLMQRGHECHIRQEPANGKTMSLTGGGRLHAAGVHAGNQTLDLWINLKITFSHGLIFPDKAGIVTDAWGLFHA